jgi:hypothetical protein
MRGTPPLLDQGRDWVGAGAGALFVVLTVVGLGVGGDHPLSTGPIEPIRSRFLTDPGPVAIQAGSYIQVIAVLLLVVFGARIARRLWIGDQPTLAAVGLAATVIAAGLVLMENALLSVLAFSVAADGDVGAIKALYALRHILLAYLYFPLALLAFALAVAALRAKLFPRWYGWSTAAFGVVLLSGGADVARSGFFMSQGDHWFYVLLLFVLWVLITSGLLLGRVRST